MILGFKSAMWKRLEDSPEIVWLRNASKVSRTAPRRDAISILPSLDPPAPPRRRHCGHPCTPIPCKTIQIKLYSCARLSKLANGQNREIMTFNLYCIISLNTCIH